VARHAGQFIGFQLANKISKVLVIIWLQEAAGQPFGNYAKINKAISK